MIKNINKMRQYSEYWTKERLRRIKNDDFRVTPKWISAEQIAYKWM